MKQYVYGKNVINQLLQSDKKIDHILMVEGFKDMDFIARIKKAKIAIQVMKKRQMDAHLQTQNHQGIAAQIEAYKTYELDDLCNQKPRQKYPIFVLLDQLEDPHNLGAILRTCDAIGVDGVIIGKHRSVSLTPTVAKVSTGAIDSVKVAIVNNLSQTCKQLKEKGFWIVGADANNAQDYRAPSYDVPLVLVIGSEGKGISPLVRKQCDYCVALPMLGKITSLNASVACAILLYAIHAKRYPL